MPYRFLFDFMVIFGKVAALRVPAAWCWCLNVQAGESSLPLSDTFTAQY